VWFARRSWRLNEERRASPGLPSGEMEVSDPVSSPSLLRFYNSIASPGRQGYVAIDSFLVVMLGFWFGSGFGAVGTERNL
jgi:hypothetical protein